MSTTDRLMLTIGMAFGWNLYKNLFNQEASDRRITRLAQTIIVLSLF